MSREQPRVMRASPFQEGRRWGACQRREKGGTAANSQERREPDRPQQLLAGCYLGNESQGA